MQLRTEERLRKLLEKEIIEWVTSCCQHYSTFFLSHFACRILFETVSKIKNI